MALRRILAGVLLFYVALHVLLRLSGQIYVLFHMEAQQIFARAGHASVPEATVIEVRNL